MRSSRKVETGSEPATHSLAREWFVERRPHWWETEVWIAEIKELWGTEEVENPECHLLLGQFLTRPPTKKIFKSK